MGFSLRTNCAVLLQACCTIGQGAPERSVLFVFVLHVESLQERSQDAAGYLLVSVDERLNCCLYLKKGSD